MPVLPPHNQGTDMADEWPLRDHLELGALPSAVSCARWHAKQVLWEWGLAELSDTVELLVSEIVTNAIHASQPLAPVRLWLLSDKERVLVLVWDTNPQPPVRMDANEQAECGRGLLLVETLSEQWATYATPDIGGKVVWCIATR